MSNSDQAVDQHDRRDESGRWVAGNRTGTPWKPGQSGNPGGRPKRAVVSNAIRSRFEDPIDSLPPVKKTAEELGIATEGRTVGEVYADVMLVQGMGSGVFCKEALDRSEGKVAERVITHEGSPAESVGLDGLDPEEAAQLRKLGGKLTSDGG